MWNEKRIEEHRAQRPLRIYREPIKYVLYRGGIGDPASTIKRALYKTEWTTTYFYHRDQFVGEIKEEQDYDLYKGSRKQVFVRRYVSYMADDGWIRLKPAEIQPKWMIGKTHEEIDEASWDTNSLSNILFGGAPQR